MTSADNMWGTRNVLVVLWRIVMGMLPFQPQLVTVTFNFILGWMPQPISTSPGLLNAYVTPLPGCCKPRLKAFPALLDRMLWGMLSSFVKTISSPALIVTSASENALSF